MADENMTYESKTVKTLRGTETQAAAKWEKQGWEVVSQTTGRLQSELVLRRPKPKSRTLLWVVGAAAVAVVLTTVIVVGSLNESGTGGDVADVTPSAISETPADPEPEAPEETAAPAPEPAPTESAVEPITAENDAAFAALLTLGDYCDPAIAAFAEQHVGEAVAFAGNVGAIAPHGDFDTRFDLLIGPGDYSETDQPGPAFQFRDENLTTDLNYVGNTPDTIGVGTNLDVTAELGEYDENSCVLVLEPVATSFR